MKSGQFEAIHKPELMVSETKKRVCIQWFCESVSRVAGARDQDEFDVS
jgi:hypothetical protein